MCVLLLRINPLLASEKINVIELRESRAKPAPVKCNDREIDEKITRTSLLPVVGLNEDPAVSDLIKWVHDTRFRVPPH